MIRISAKYVAVLASLGLLCFVGSHGVCAPTATVQAIRVTSTGAETTVNIDLSGSASPTLSLDGLSLTVLLPGAVASGDLSSQCETAGLVSSSRYREEPRRAGMQVCLSLKAPSVATLKPGRNPHGICVEIARETAPAKEAVESRATKPASPPIKSAALLQTHTVKRTQAAAVLSETSKSAAATPSLTAASTAPQDVAPLKLAALPSPATAPDPIAAPPAPRIVVPITPAPRLYDVNAYQSDIAGVLDSLAQEAHISIVMASGASGKVTMNLHQVPAAKAIDLLTKAVGLAYHQDGETYVIGQEKDIQAAYPQTTSQIIQSVYVCQQIKAADLVTSLANTFDKDDLRVSIGAAFTSPDLDNDASQVVTQIQGQAVQSSSGSGGPSDPNLAARTVILAGNPDTVAQALALARQLDVKRRQVKIDLRITDISVDAEHDLGLQWNFGSESLTENHTSGLGLGSFTRSPLDVDATISAMESQDLAHLLAAPTLTLLDGEHSYILIGQKLLYPVVVGYTQSNTPIFDKAEEDVGIYMQVAADIDDDNEITLTIYPQVSEISGYLNVNGASYPQISTREQQTTVRVRDGEQIVIGGLLQDDDINNLQRVPGLSKIPFFGQLFNSRSRSKTRDEVVVIITPQIIQD